MGLKIAGVEFNDQDKTITFTQDADGSLYNIFRTSDRTYKYSQIESYEYTENQSTVAKGGGVGRALVGGMLFGSTAAIVGATTGKRKMNNTIEAMDVRVTLRVGNGIKLERITLEPGGTKYGSLKYEKCLAQARQITDKLDQITQQIRQQAQTRTMANNMPLQNSMAQPAIDVKAKLIELKDLYEQGLIDEEEYKDEKKVLLDVSRNGFQAAASSLPLNLKPETPAITYQSFVMSVDDVFGITGKGIVVTGVVKRGSVNLNDEVLILHQDGTTTPAWVSGIESNKQVLERASEGNSVGLMLANIDRAEASKGDSIIIESVGSLEDNMYYRESTSAGIGEAREAVEKILKPSPATSDVETSIQKPRHKNYFDGIDRSGRAFYREKERETFNFAMNAIECAQEDAWNHMPESTQNQFEYVTEAVQSEIIKRINDFMAAKSFAIATKGENKKLFETAVTKLSSYMDADDLIMVVDKAVFKHNFQSGFAIGYKRVYLARDTKNNKIYTVDFQDIEKLKPDPVTDQWVINDDPNLILNYETLPNMTLAIALIIVRSYVVHGEEYSLKLE